MRSTASRQDPGSVAGGRAGGPPPTISTSSVSRSGRTRGAAARAEANRRAAEPRPEGEATVHVLDSGVNRTPLPLQPRHSLLGAREGGGGGGGHHRRPRGEKRGSGASTASGMGSSIFHSSFLMSSDGQSDGAANPTESGMASYLQSGASNHRRGNGWRKGSVIGSMESSMASLSMAGDSGSQSQLPAGASERSESMVEGGGGRGGDEFGSTSGPTLPGLADAQPETLLDGAVYARPAAMSDAERRAWLRAQTTVRLTETPTVVLFSRQDEAVSNEDPDLADDVQERNAVYADLVERHRVDEGTHFQERGTATFAVAKKSIHCEVRPPPKVDAGALLVTPWMLRDAQAPLLEDADDDGEDGAGAGGAAGGKRHAGTDAADGDGGGDEGDAELAGDLDGADGEEGSTAMDDGSASGHRGSASVEGGAGVGGRASAAAGRQWMLSESLMPTLRIMERAVVQNLLERTQLAYRGIPMAPEAARRSSAKTTAAAAAPGAPPSTTTTTTRGAKAAAKVADTDGSAGGGAAVGDAAGSPVEGVDVNGTGGGAVAVNGAGEGGEGPATDPLSLSDLPPMTLSEGVRALWRYHCPLTRGRAVTCMTWNRRETSILAVGYSPCLDSDAEANAEAGVTGAGGGGGGGGRSPAVTLAAGAAGGAAGGAASAAQSRGMICCWSLKNPLAPELVLHLQADAGVSALAFSAEHPSLLAVGDTEGGLVVYDIQKDLATPSIVPAVSTGLHTGAVWDLRWVTSGKERGEFLMSISADGRIVQWAVAKTVERVAPDLMHLKRQPGALVESVFVEGVAAAEEAAAASAAARRGGGKARAGAAAARAAGGGGGSKEDAVLSRQSGGMCFDVCPSDHAIYIVGTEEGAVCQYNKSQTETYDLEYAAHTDLVYRVRWSPFSARYFLTCSADWTTRLYALGQARPLVVFDSPHRDAVQDVAWSHCNALSFATATAQGNVELWSVGNTVYPRATVRYEDGRRLNCLLFAEQETPVVVVGDDKGDVTVFLLKNSVYGRQDLMDDEQEMWLDEAVKKGA